MKIFIAFILLYSLAYVFLPEDIKSKDMKKLLFMFVAIIFLFVGKYFLQEKFFTPGEEEFNVGDIVNIINKVPKDSEVSSSSVSWPFALAKEGCYFGRGSGGVVGCYNSLTTLEETELLE